SGFGSGFLSTGFSTGFCSGALVEVTTSFFLSSILPMASSTGLASATFSTSGLGLSFSPFFMPAVIFLRSAVGMISTGSASGTTSSAREEKEINPHPITRMWSATDATIVLSTFSFTSGTLLGNDHDARLETRVLDVPQQLHHVGVADVPVTAQID